MSADHNPDWPQRFAELAASSQDERLRAYYAAGCITADTPLAEAPLVALDVETTGLDPREHAIVSLGLVPLDLQRIRCAEARYWVVKPTSELSAESVTFHHITHSDIRHAPRLAHVLEELLEALAGKVVVAHYRNIERNFLDQALREHLGEGLLFPIIDTMVGPPARPRTAVHPPGRQPPALRPAAVQRPPRPDRRPRLRRTAAGPGGQALPGAYAGGRAVELKPLLQARRVSRVT